MGYKLKCNYLFDKLTFNKMFSIHLRHALTIMSMVKNIHPFENLEFSGPNKSINLEYGYQNQHPNEELLVRSTEILLNEQASRTKVVKSKSNSRRSMSIC